MARRGRNLELLIEQLEKAALPVGATIFSPGYIRDKITDQQREIDILVEYTVGTFQIRIVLECRDRAEIQDTTWIEQIHSKINDLNIHKAIAVSSSDFSEPAKIKAKHYGIETRTLSEINPGTIADWWKLEYVHYYSQNSALVRAEIGLEFPDQFQEVLLERTFTDKFFYRTTDDQVFSILEIIPPKESSLWAKCTENGPPVPLSLHGKYENPKDRFYVMLNNKKCAVTDIIFHLELTITKKSYPISRVAKYETDGKIFSHIIEYDGIDINGNKKIQFIKREDGSINMYLS